MQLELKDLKEQRLKERNYEPYICWTCGKSFIEDYREDKGSVKKKVPRFCSRKCSCSYSSRSQDQTKIKSAKCSVCGNLKEINIHRSTRNFVCNDCKYTKKRKHKFKKDSEENLKSQKHNHNNIDKRYLYPDTSILGRFERSKFYLQKSVYLQRIGFDFENLNWECEFFKIRNLLYIEYYEKKKSGLELSKLFNFKSWEVPAKMLRLFGFNKIRSHKESSINSYVTGRNNLSTSKEINKRSNYQFKHGWAETQFGKFYYRSGYELNLINLLSSKNVRFTCNEFKINYLSSIDNLTHVGYPDFYLPDYNLIIETKNKVNFDYVDLSDRYRVIKKKKFGLYYY